MQLSFFDYATLDSETRIVVQQRTSEIKALMRRAAQDIIDIGQKLIEVKARLPHGEFGGWLVAEFEWSQDTANNFMRVATRFGDNPIISEFAPSALYLLAAPSTPEPARHEAIERATAGEPITFSAAREIVNGHRTPRQSYQCGACAEWFDAPVWHCPHCDHHYHEQDETCHNCYRPRHMAQSPTATAGASPYDARFVPTAADYADPYGDADAFARDAASRQQRMAVTVYSSESNEWYTPAWVADLAREVMGGIDLDPASNAIANGWVKAAAYHTIDDDGYTRPWAGRVWLNPPYGKEEGESQSNTIRWSRKLIAERAAGRVPCGILLVKAALGYNWFEELWYHYPVCFLRERLSFVRPDGSDEGQSKQATALLYFGDDVARFRSVYRPYGRVILPDDEGAAA